MFSPDNWVIKIQWGGSKKLLINYKGITKSLARLVVIVITFFLLIIKFTSIYGGLCEHEPI